jgi:hypothetical protein
MRILFFPHVYPKSHFDDVVRKSQSKAFVEVMKPRNETVKMLIGKMHLDGYFLRGGRAAD